MSAAIQRAWVFAGLEPRPAECSGGPLDGALLPVSGGEHAFEARPIPGYGLRLTGQGYRLHVHFAQYRDYTLVDVEWRWSAELVEWLSARTFARLGGYQGA